MTELSDIELLDLLALHGGSVAVPAGPKSTPLERHMAERFQRMGEAGLVSLIGRAELPCARYAITAAGSRAADAGDVVVQSETVLTPEMIANAKAARAERDFEDQRPLLEIRAHRLAQEQQRLDREFAERAKG